MPAGPCLFCGRGRAVRTRVMPDWLDLCFPDDRPFNAKRALACKDCTSGWIKQLEHHSRPLVSGMIAGLPVVLAQQNQEMLARWVAKTVLSLQALRDPELLPLGEWDVEPTFPGTMLDHYYAEMCLGHLVIRVGAAWTPHGYKLPVGPAAI